MRKGTKKKSGSRHLTLRGPMIRGGRMCSHVIKMSFLHTLPSALSQHNSKYIFKCGYNAAGTNFNFISHSFCIRKQVGY